MRSYTFLLLEFRQWRSRADRVLILVMNIRLPLFWSTWSRAWGPDSLPPVAGRQVRLPPSARPHVRCTCDQPARGGKGHLPRHQPPAPAADAASLARPLDRGVAGFSPPRQPRPHPCRRPCAASPSPADAPQHMHERAPFDNVDMSETRVSHRQMHRSTSSTGASGLACHATPAMAAARRARTRSNTTEPAAVALAAAAAAAAAAGDSPPPPLPPPPRPTSFGVGHTPLPRMFLCT